MQLVQILNPGYEFSLHVYFTTGSADLLDFFEKWDGIETFDIILLNVELFF